MKVVQYQGKSIPSFRDEREMLDYDIATIKAGKNPLPQGSWFGVDRCVTAVDETGNAVLEADIGGASYSAPVRPFIKSPAEMLPSSVPPVGGAPSLAYPQETGTKPMVLKVDYDTAGQPLQTTGEFYGIAPIIIVLVIILVAVIAAAVYAVLEKVNQMTKPQKDEYTDEKGCRHVRYTTQSTVFSQGGITDCDNCTGECTNLSGGPLPWPFATGAFGGAGIASQIGNAAMGLGVIAVIIGIVYGIYRFKNPRLMAVRRGGFW